MFISAHFSDACKFLSMTGHFANQHVLIANKQWLDSLDPEFQRLIREAARDIIPDYNRQWDESVAEALGVMEERGVSVNEVNDVSAFIRSIQPVYDAYADIVPPELVSRIRLEAENEHCLPNHR